MLDLMTLYTTQRKQYVHWSYQSNHRVGTQQESGLGIIRLDMFCINVQITKSSAGKLQDASYLKCLEMITLTNYANFYF